MKRLRWYLPLALTGALLSPVWAANWDYTVGPNTVNMSGTSCRASNSNNELLVRHYAGETAVAANSNQQRLYCPIVRRGTSFYGGKRTDGVVPLPVSNTEKKVKIDGVTVRAADGSTTHTVGCFVFGQRLSDGSIFYGLTKFLCESSTLGCSFGTGSWTGTNSVVLTAPFDQTTETVNYGVICDLGPSSKVIYTQASITPN